MLLQQIINGLTIGSTYALVAIGFTLVFGVLELPNFANGSLYMLGAYFTLIFFTALNGSFIIAVILSILFTGLAGYLLDRFALRLLRKQNAPRLTAIITTLGAAMLIEHGIMVFIGSETRSFPNVFMDFGTIRIGDAAVVTWTQIILFLVAASLMLLLSFLLYRTKLGKAMRSTAQNLDAARLMGININRVISFTFICSGFLASIAGTMVGMLYHTVGATMSQQIGMKVFASAILGGVGVLPGAMVGGLLLGVIEAIVAGYISSGYRDAIAFTILILVLLFRPTGLFGQKQITKV